MAISMKTAIFSSLLKGLFHMKAKRFSQPWVLALEYPGCDDRNFLMDDMTSLT